MRTSGSSGSSGSSVASGSSGSSGSSGRSVFRFSNMVAMGAVGVLAALFIVELVRGVDRVESFALVLFAVVAAAARLGVRWAVGASLAATVLYALARRNALDLASTSAVNRMIVGRAIGFLVFGVMLALVIRAVRAMPSAGVETQIDDRDRAVALAQTEFARAQRYDRPLSVLPIENGLLAKRELPTLRGSDLLVRRADGGLTIVLPETDLVGASVVAKRIGAETSVVRSLPQDPAIVRELIDQL